MTDSFEARKPMPNETREARLIRAREATGKVTAQIVGYTAEEIAYRERLRENARALREATAALANTSWRRAHAVRVAAEYQARRDTAAAQAIADLRARLESKARIAAVAAAKAQRLPSSAEIVTSVPSSLWGADDEAEDIGEQPFLLNRPALRGKVTAKVSTVPESGVRSKCPALGNFFQSVAIFLYS